MSHNFDDLVRIVSGYLQVNVDEEVALTEIDIEEALKDNRRLVTASLTPVKDTVYYTVDLRDFIPEFGISNFVEGMENDGTGDYYYSMVDRLFIVVSNITLPYKVLGYQYLRYNATVDLLSRLLAHYKTAHTFSSGVTRIGRGEIYDQILELRNLLLRQCQPTTVKVRVD